MWKLLLPFSGYLSAIVERVVLTGVTAAVAYGAGKGMIDPVQAPSIAAEAGAALLALGSIVFGVIKTSPAFRASALSQQVGTVAVDRATAQASPSADVVPLNRMESQSGG